MKKPMIEISPKYIVDSTGKETEVVLDITTFEQMLEYLEDIYFGIKAEKALAEGEFVKFDEIKRKSAKK